MSTDVTVEKVMKQVILVVDCADVVEADRLYDDLASQMLDSGSVTIKWREKATVTEA